jgi:ABC-type amino acid transport substrate-binding protein
MRIVLLAGLFPLLLAACNFPRDADGTLDRVGGGALRVGVSEHRPWVVQRNGKAEGIEPSLIARWAESLNAKVEWSPGSESELAKALEEGRYDLLIGGFTTSSPWVSKAAPTQPYYRDHVILARQGENALLLSLDRFLSEERRQGRVGVVGDI